MFINDPWGLAELDQSHFLLFYLTLETLLVGQKYKYFFSSLTLFRITRGYLYSCPCPCLREGTKLP